ncbi:MAG: hypothetical protein JWN98_830 [Abditibacteriota bacterium]|nr:hypothetical protein [Abditibacteriota bacterium]
MSKNQVASAAHNELHTASRQVADRGFNNGPQNSGSTVAHNKVHSATVGGGSPTLYRPSTGHSHTAAPNGSRDGFHNGHNHSGHNLVSGKTAASRSVQPQTAQNETRPRNRLLATLSAEEWERLSPYVGRTLLIEGQNLYHAGQAIERIYFPNTGLVSMVVNARDGSQVEVGVAGREGLAGDLSLLTGSNAMLRAIVQTAGTACWLPATVVREEFRRGGSFQQHLLQYFQVLTAQSAQCALCNRLHTVEERLSRWLLVIRDRLETDEIDITHEFIAHMLGTRRSGVTVALGVLQQAGLIDITRGHIAIRDVRKLAGSACECYGIISKQFETLNANTIA